MCPRFSSVIDPLHIKVPAESNSPFHHPVLPARCDMSPLPEKPSPCSLPFLPVSFLRLGLANTELLPSLAATTLQYLPPSFARPTRQISVGSLSLSFLRLIRSLRHVLLLNQTSTKAAARNHDVQVARVSFIHWLTQSLPRSIARRGSLCSPADRRQSRYLRKLYRDQPTRSNIPVCQEPVGTVGCRKQSFAGDRGVPAWILPTSLRQILCASAAAPPAAAAVPCLLRVTGVVALPGSADDVPASLSSAQPHPGTPGGQVPTRAEWSTTL